MNIGSSELFLVLIVALLVFGPSKLPELGRTVGRAVGEFRKATRDLQQTWELEAANAMYPDAPAGQPPKVSTAVPAVVADEKPPAEAADVATN